MVRKGPKRRFLTCVLAGIMFIFPPKTNMLPAKIDVGFVIKQFPLLTRITTFSRYSPAAQRTGPGASSPPSASVGWARIPCVCRHQLYCHAYCHRRGCRPAGLRGLGCRFCACRSLAPGFKIRAALSRQRIAPCSGTSLALHAVSLQLRAFLLAATLCWPWRCGAPAPPGAGETDRDGWCRRGCRR